MSLPNKSLSSFHSPLSSSLFPLFLWKFQKKFVTLHRRLLALRGKAGGLIYEKDVFERLSLWVVNLASSYLYNRQMTTRRLRSAFLYTLKSATNSDAD